MCVYVNVSVFSGAELFMHRVFPLYVDDPVLHRLQLTEGLKVSLEGAACLGDALRCQVILHLFMHFRSQFAVAERAAGRTAAGGGVGICTAARFRVTGFHVSRRECLPSVCPFLCRQLLLSSLMLQHSGGAHVTQPFPVLSLNKGSVAVSIKGNSVLLTQLSCRRFGINVPPENRFEPL